MKNSEKGKSCVTLQSFSLKAQRIYMNNNNNTMILPKSKNYFRFPKILFKITLFILLSSKIFAQNVGTPAAPAATPTTTAAPAPTTTAAPAPATTTNTANTAKAAAPAATPKGAGAVVPVMRTTQPAAINGTNNRVVLGGDNQLITREDSIAALKQEAIQADLAKTAFRKRIFGYNLFNTAKVEFVPQLNIATPSNYVLGANDQLIIDIYGYSQITYKLAISPDGYITVDKGVGLIYVAGSSIEQAKTRIIDRLSKVFVGLRGSNPNTFCNISLGNIRSIKVTVTGEVVAAGTYTVPSLTTALNVLYLCGGPNDIGSFRKIQVIRQNKVVATLDLYDLLMKGYTAGNILLQDQDIIQIVPYLSRIAIDGFVKRGGLFELEKGEKLEHLIYYAGGFKPGAYTHRLKLYRDTPRERKIIDVEQSQFKAFEMMTGDSIRVEQVLKRFENMVSINGAVFRPGEYSLDNNLTLMALLKSAEGIKGEAMLGRISIQRINENMSVENLALNLDDIMKGRTPDIALKREDMITIPSLFDLTEPSYIHVEGAINNPLAGDVGIDLPFVRNMTIEDVLIKVGGLTEAASLSRVEVVRRKRNIDPSKTNAQVSDIYDFDVRPDLKVEEAGAKFILYPFDQIFIRTSPNYQKQTFADVLGEVFYPSTYGIKSKDEKISDLVLRAGGLTPLAYLEGATLIRKVQLSDIELEQRRKQVAELAATTAATGTQTLTVETIDKNTTESIGINLTKIMANPGSDADMLLQDGDIIRIPKRLETVRIQGEVLYPTTVKYYESAKFLNYISRSGGFTKRSLKSRAYVLYANGSVDRTRHFLLINIFPKIAPGAEIIVPQRSLTTQQQITQIGALFTAVAGTLGTIVTVIGILRLTK